MRLVGAPSLSIQLPFILEGLLAALVGGGVGYCDGGLRDSIFRDRYSFDSAGVH